MKVVTVVGARPQFIKAFPVSMALADGHEEKIVHTGQHYDERLSAVFFDELEIPRPSYHLGIGSAPPGAQTGRMMAALEPVITEERPDVILTYGDTNSTLAAALVGSKTDALVAHVEAGLRSDNRTMPEEINRILSDHAADVLLAPTQRAVDRLEREGISTGVHQPGDVMVDALEWAKTNALDSSRVTEEIGVEGDRFVLATIHREGNTDDPDRLEAIVRTLGSLSETVIFPAHPRAVDRLQANGLWEYVQTTLQVIEPVGYVDFLALIDASWRVATDSGGIQKEAFLLETPCITLREETEWPETVDAGGNVLVGTAPSRIRRAFRRPFSIDTESAPFGEGNAAVRLVSILEQAVRSGTGRRPVFPHRSIMQTPDSIIEGSDYGSRN